MLVAAFSATLPLAPTGDGRRSIKRANRDGLRLIDGQASGVSGAGHHLVGAGGQCGAAHFQRITGDGKFTVVSIIGAIARHQGKGVGVASIRVHGGQRAYRSTGNGGGSIQSGTGEVGGGRRFVDVGGIDGHRFADGVAGGVRGNHVDAVAGLGFKVGGGDQFHGTCRVDGKRRGIGAGERIAEGIAFRVGGGGGVDHGAGGGIFRHAASGPAGDAGCFVHIGDIEGHHLGGGMSRILGVDGDAVAALDFKVCRGEQLDLAGSGVDRERRGIGAGQRIGQGITFRIGGGGGVDHGAGGGVFRHAAAGPTGDGRRSIKRANRDGLRLIDGQASGVSGAGHHLVGAGGQCGAAHFQRITGDGKFTVVSIIGAIARHQGKGVGVASIRVHGGQRAYRSTGNGGGSIQSGTGEVGGGRRFVGRWWH